MTSVSILSTDVTDAQNRQSGARFVL